MALPSEGGGASLSGGFCMWTGRDQLLLSAAHAALVLSLSFLSRVLD